MITDNDYELQAGARCIGCGCTEEMPCVGQNTPTGTCFWIDVAEDTGRGICSACVTKPLEELERRFNLVA